MLENPTGKGDGVEFRLFYFHLFVVISHMPRQARIDAPGALHHIICRGIERRNIFKDNTNRNRFLERLGSVLQKTSALCYGWALTKITERVAEIFGIEKDQVVVAGKQPDRVRARSVLAYLAIRALGLTATEIGKYLGLSKSAISRAANRGQKLIVDQFLSLKDYKRVISTPSPFFYFAAAIT